MIWNAYLIFFLSGAAALIFESLWFRLAELVFGNSVWGVALVLSGFMAGLALGNFFVARYGHHIKKPMFFYATLELMIGFAGFSLVLILPELQQLLIPLFRPFLDHLLFLNLIRLSIVFTILIIPTMAMGATLPIMVRSLSILDKNFGSVLGNFYGVNTLGAVIGVLLCEFLLIKWLGIRNSGAIATSLNFMAAVLALRIAPNLDHLCQKSDSKNKDILKDFSLITESRNLLIAAFLSGGILLALEVVWFRFLLLFKFGTSRIFAVMLAIVLTGICIGGLFASVLYRRNIDITRFIKEFSLIGGFLTLVTYIYFDSLYLFMDTSKLPVFTSFMVFSLFLIFPVSLMSGMLFTTLGSAIKENYISDTGAVGLLTLANTIGAMGGALIAGFALLPLAGMEKSFYILALCYGVIALVIPKQYSAAREMKIKPVYLAAAVYLVVLVFFPFDKMMYIYFQQIVDKYKATRLIDVREGQVATNFYLEHDYLGKPIYYRLVTNGHSMSSTDTPSKRYMKFFVYLPITLHPDIKNALLISYGHGSTAKALVDTQSIESIDIVDISEDVLEMSDVLYQQSDDHPLHDNRVNVHIEDGRFYLLTTPRHFDLITAEPPPPKGAGIVNLYSQEYFQLIYDRLTEGGITTYWLPAHMLQISDSKAIIKAFCNVFNDCSLWNGAGLDWILMGTRNITGPVSEEHFTLQWHIPEVARELKTLGFENPEQLGTTFIADANLLKQLTNNTLPVTDNFPQRLSPQNISNRFISSQYYSIMSEQYAIERFSQSKFIERIWPQTLKQKTTDYFKYQRMINIRFMPPDYRKREDYDLDDLHTVLTSTSLETLPLWIMNSSQEAQIIINQLINENHHSPEITIYLAIRAIAKQDYLTAIKYLEDYLKIDMIRQTSQAYTLYIYALCMAGRIEEATIFLSNITSSFPPNEENMRFLSWLKDNFGMNISNTYIH